MIFRYLNKDLESYSKDKNKILSDLPKFQKLMEDIIENLLLEENEEKNFLEFCELKMIEEIIEITQFQENSINLIIIKIFLILIPSLKNNKIMFYLFSNNYMNQIISNISYNKEDNDIDYLSFYINLLKTLVNKLDISSFALFFNSSHNKFPLLDEIIIFLTFDKDDMIKNTSRNIFLSLLKMNHIPFIEYICDLPTITLFLLFAQHLKEQIKYFCDKESNNLNKININNYTYKINEIEERKEIIRDDICFIQDILSLNIPKINYLLINSIFYIPVSYLFNNILTRQNASISFYILELFLEIKNEAIKNIIIFILYCSHIQIKIIEIVANEVTKDIMRLLKLNKYVFHSNMCNIKSKIDFNPKLLVFDDYIILNYSKKFLKSLRYVRDSDNTYKELKDISSILNCNENDENDINIAIKLLNKKVDRINFVIKQIENYHGFISKATGVNCGASNSSANECFLQIIYNNLLAYKDNNILQNIYLQENTFKNECMYYIYDFHLSQYISTVNELFLINQIINDNSISEKLKLNLNLIKNSSEGEKNENDNNIFININSIDDISDAPKIEKSDSISGENEENFDTPPAADAFEVKNNNKINLIDKNIINFSVIQYKNKEAFKNLFGEDNYIQNNYMNYSSSSILSLPSPVNNNINISKFNNNINLIVENKILNYSDMNFDNKFFDKILLNYKSNNELEIANNLVNLLIDGKKILNKLLYKLSIDIIEDLLLNSINFWPIKRKYQTRINEHYKQVLQMINDFFEKNSLDDQLYSNNYFYALFEECFIFNTKNIEKDIKEEIFKKPILLIGQPKEEEGYEQYTSQLNLLKIPDEKYQIIKCLFQKFLSLYDLKYIINNFNDIEIKKLLKYQKFPLYFFDLSEFKIDSKINLTKLQLQLESHNIKLKMENEEYFSDGLMIFYKNYVFFCIPFIENKDNKDIKDKKDDNNNQNNKFETIKGDDNNNNINDDLYIIKQRAILRNIEIIYNSKEDNNKKNNNNKEQEDKERMIILNLDNKYKIKLLFEDIYQTAKYLEIIKHSKKKAIEMEYNSLKIYINKLLKDYSTINN